MKKFSMLVALVGVAVTTQASILTFDGNGSNVEITGGWGSNIAADGTGFNVSNGSTPNVALDWTVGAGGTKEERWDFYTDGEWAGVGQLNDFETGIGHYLTLTADTGYGVILDSFVFDDYAGYGNAAGNDFSWALYEDDTAGSVIASGSTTTANGQNLTINTGMATSYGTVVLELVQNGIPANNWGDDQALDDISFTQEVIPEPAALGLLVLGSAGVLFMRRFGMIG